MTNLSKYQNDLKKLIELYKTMMLDLRLKYDTDKSDFSKEQKEKAKSIENTFEEEYQNWYTESCVAIKQIVPNRLTEFISYYKGDGKTRNDSSGLDYTIQDWLIGVRSATSIHTGRKIFEDDGTMMLKFKTQGSILKSVKTRFESSLYEIKQLVQADLFDNELESAKELLRKGFVRASGAICGVVIEKHLKEVCTNHNIVIRKKNLTINDYNESLKTNDVIGVPDWRFIQRLADLRNLCDHNKDKEPTKIDIEELINGTDKITKTIF